jgi:hypothetical protein
MGIENGHTWALSFYTFHTSIEIELPEKLLIGFNQWWINPYSGERFFFWAIKAHHTVKGSIWRGQPIVF